MVGIKKLGCLGVLSRKTSKTPQKDESYQEGFRTDPYSNLRHRKENTTMSSQGNVRSSGYKDAADSLGSVGHSAPPSLQAQSARGSGSSRETPAQHYAASSRQSQSSRRSGPAPPASARGSVRSGRTSDSNASITSSVALGKLTQLEQLLDREREARRAAEMTLRTIVNTRHPKQGAAEGNTQRQLEAVMSTLQTIISDTDAVPQGGAGSGRRERVRPPAKHASSTADSSQKQRTTAARRGFTMDHKGGLHFAMQGEQNDVNIITQLPALSRR